MSEVKRVKQRRATPAFKLLAFLLYSGVSCIKTTESNCVYITSFRTLSRFLGTSSGSKSIRNWLVWLEDRGYVDSVVFSKNMRQAKIKLRPPRNVGILNG